MMCELLSSKPEGPKDVCVAGVFDGHGLLGERAASAAAAKLKEICHRPGFNAKSFISKPAESMRELFTELQAAVIAEHDTPPDQYVYPGNNYTLHFVLKKHDHFGKAFWMDSPGAPPAPIDFGCTAVVAVVVDSFVCVGNAGDASGVLCLPQDEDAPARVLTERHNAQERAEAARIERDFAGKAVITPDGYLAPLDPQLSQYEVQTTRCLGHRLLSAAGVSCDPAITCVSLRGARALVLCSDGVSDELQPRDIADRAVAAGSAAEAAATLCSDAQDFCMEQEKVDDCTCVVLLFSQAAV